MRITTWISFAVMVSVLILAGRQGLRVDDPDPAALARNATSRIAHSERFRFDRQSPRATPQREGASDEAVTDLYGNDITDAVARYKLDAEGSLYEQHSPRTELPRLRPPKS